MSNEFKLVPVEPTEEMIAAVEGDSYTFATGDEEWIGCLSSDMAEEIYSNMLAAAPQPPALVGELDARQAFDDWFRKDLGLPECANTTFIGAAREPWRAWQACSAVYRAHIAPLQAEIEESNAVIDQLSKILAGIAVSLRGEELQLHRHGYHDLVERVTVLKLENDLRLAETAQLKARCDELECDHEWTDDGEFNLHCTNCGKQENHEPYGWVQTRGNAINHFTQEWDVVEEWEAQGFEYKPMFDAAQSTPAERDPVEYGPTPGCKQCQEAENCGLTDCPECNAQLCEDVNGDGVRPAGSEKV